MKYINVNRLNNKNLPVHMQIHRLQGHLIKVTWAALKAGFQHMSVPDLAHKYRTTHQKTCSGLETSPAIPHATAT